MLLSLCVKIKYGDFFVLNISKLDVDKCLAKELSSCINMLIINAIFK